MRDLRYVSRRVLIPRRAGDPGGTFPGYWSGSRRIGIAGCGPALLYVFLFCRPDDADGCAVPLNVASWTASFPHLRDVIERIPADCERRGITEVVAQPWSSGRVVLLGDAAHAMAPTLGQGACISMQAAVALAEGLDRIRDVRSALEAWEASQRPVIDATQRYGRIYIRLLTGWPRALTDLRSLAVWGATHSSSLQRRLAGAPALPR